MHLVRLGARCLNLEYLIRSEDREDGSILLVLQSGQPEEVSGAEATWLRGHLAEIAHGPDKPSASKVESRPLVRGRTLGPLPPNA